MELKNKVIIVTGASSGIGAAAARLFAAEGAKVVLSGRRTAELENVVAMIKKANGSAEYLIGDVNDESYAKSLVEVAEREFGGLDGAFNNAGITGKVGPIPEMSAGDWHEVINTNLTSGFYAAKYQIPAMINNGGGSIVFTSSFVGYANSGLPGLGAYAASKAGLIGLTLSLASQHGKNSIRVNALLPGVIRTPMIGTDPETLNFVANLHPLQRIGEPIEIAQSALFLLSDRSEFVTGSAVNADGGISCRLV